ncbi:sugar ABC transporter substrate-binding protein [Arachnia propionica]|uniref:Sugar ABC transporter substrate-binding protein n=1 Tax=Arachnia propionica TaxID=1750 RepID=A0A3P1T404_9ACTN|nr:sugar-binding protein [Arachnia propionica]RRD04201.1 sugar ABC transporter substrate-binding protein [Arachnia propionica]
MKFKAGKLLVAAVAATLGLTACGGGRTAETDSAAEASGFAADATIGVALPWLGSQNWKEAEVEFQEQLTAAGFKPLIQSADNKVPQQQQQIETMIQQGAKVIVVGPIDSTQLGSVVERAKAEGITIIGYDRTIDNTTGVDAVIQYSSVRTGEMQAESLLEGLRKTKGEGPYNVELFGGGPADPNAPNFFTGAMTVLQPKIDDGTITVVSGQTDFTQAAIPEWDNAKAQARMDSLLSGFYADKRIDGVLCPNDGIARSVLTSAAQAGQEAPVTTGLDAENESVLLVRDGKQYSTTAKPTDAMVAKTVEMVKTLQRGEKLTGESQMLNNGAKDVAIFELDPIVVTKENLTEVFADDEERMKLIEG